MERLRHETPAVFIALDLLARGDDDLRGLPLRERRAALEELLADARLPLLLTPLTSDPAAAEGWLDVYRASASTA